MAATFVKTALKFCVPFVTSNLRLLAGKRAEGMNRHPREKGSP